MDIFGLPLNTMKRNLLNGGLVLINGRMGNLVMEKLQDTPSVA